MIDELIWAVLIGSIIFSLTIGYHTVKDLIEAIKKLKDMKDD